MIFRADAHLLKFRLKALVISVSQLQMFQQQSLLTSPNQISQFAVANEPRSQKRIRARGSKCPGHHRTPYKASPEAKTSLCTAQTHTFCVLFTVLVTPKTSLWL